MGDVGHACTLARKYSGATGKSVKIQLDIWKYSSEPNVRISTQISTVDPKTFDCHIEYRKTLDEIATYVKSREILFRRFNGN